MPIEQLSNAIIFYAFYTNDGVGETGLTVTIDVYEGTNGTPIVNGGSATELAGGLYYYTLTSGSVDAVGEYVAVFKTTSEDVDQKHLPAIWTIGRAGVENLDAPIATVDTVADAIKAVTDNLPDSGALTSIAQASAVTTLTNRIGAFTGSGVNTVLGMFKALASKIASTPSDIGGTFDPATDSMESLQEDIAAISVSGASAAEVWGYADRTLTQSAASVTAAVSGSDLTIRRGDTFTAAITGLGSIANRSKLWFTVKDSKSESDNDALIQIEATAGLTRFQGAAYGTAADGSITIDDEDAGDITITIKPAATTLLWYDADEEFYYDIQVLTTVPSISTLTEGDLTVERDVTRATS
ncbi:MAG: hypothetical protein PVJ86_00345 [Phycisphaerales bacterium]|jgi:hypothetical protein